MKTIDKLEKKFGKFAIKGIMLYVIALNLAVYLLEHLVGPEGILTYKLILDPSLIAKGELWRFITFIFIPPEASPIFIIFALYFYYIVGSGLEHEWGSFKFNVYYFIGILGTILSVYISGGLATAFYLNLSLFLAFAYIFPDYQILLFFVLPIKIKYLAWLDAFYLGFSFMTGNLSIKLMIIAAILNFIIFFGKDILMSIKRNGLSYSKKKKYTNGMSKKGAFHRCTICGITEEMDKNMEFRFCADCEGDYEYCMIHLKEHTHIKK